MVTTIIELLKYQIEIHPNSARERSLMNTFG